MPPVTVYVAVDLSYTEEEAWGATLTRYLLDAQMAGRPLTFAFALPVNAARAKVVFSRQVEMTDAEVADLLDPKPDPRVEAFGPIPRSG
jgi:hypothetical protein